VNFSPIRLKTVPLAVAAMLTGMASTAFAGPLTVGNITLDATYSLGGGAQVDGMTDPSSNVYTTADGADFYLFKSSGSPNNVFFHTYGFTGGSTYFGARASGEGTFTGQTQATYSNSFTNTSGVAQIYNFAFMVDQGELGISGEGNAFASLLLNVKKNGATIAKDFTSITQTFDGTNSTLACADDDLGLAYMGCGSATASSTFGAGGLFNVSFGSIAAGETFTLDYDIIATVSGNLSSTASEYYQACSDGYGGYGEASGTNDVNVEIDLDKEICFIQTSFPGSAIARSGDPFNGPLFGNGDQSARNEAGLQVTSSPANGVPEPGSMALIGLGLAGLAAARRKKPATAQ
jgi:hypothetical protein